jgi:2-polyprenyl-3-methyl-5-hydroxy-6-metoxy-1,4-benzoquinol methylase
MNAAASAPPTVPTGNRFDKYGSRNPLVRGLMGGFERALDELFAAAAPGSVLDVGCGEGVLAQRWAEQLGSGRVVGLDLADPKLEGEWSKRRRENLEFRAASAAELPFADGEFDLVAGIEVLEHLEDPRPALAEMTRVAAAFLLVSVPREPLWRALNLARGAYVRELGNTPGHLHHFSRRAFLRLLEAYGEPVAARTPLPWQMLLVRVG